jgi:hypothetical protein
MNVKKLLANPRFRWESHTAPDPDRLEQFLRSAPDNLPRTYVKFIQQTNGGTGPNPFDTGPLEIWPVERVLERNEALDIAHHMPGFFAFGENGQGSVYLFDLREPDGAPVCSIDAGASEDAEPKLLRKSFSEALESTMLVRERI